MDDQSRRKFLKQFAVMSASIGIVTLTGCDIIIPEERSLYGPPPVKTDPPDDTGNIFICNKTGIELVLYDRYRILKVLPAVDSPYRVNIFRRIHVESELEIFRYYAMSNIDNPPTSDIFKKWIVKLPADAVKNPYYVWVIDNSNTKECGELIFQYHPSVERGQPEIQVDVKLLRLETEHFCPGSAGFGILACFS